MDVIKLPFLPDNIIAFFMVYFMETYIFMTGLMFVDWISFYHVEMSISMGTMFEVIGEQLREAVDPDDVNALIESHQGLLDSSKTFTRLFSTAWLIIFISTTISLWT